MADPEADSHASTTKEGPRETLNRPVRKVRLTRRRRAAADNTRKASGWLRGGGGATGARALPPFLDGVPSAVAAILRRGVVAAVDCAAGGAAAEGGGTAAGGGAASGKGAAAGGGAVVGAGDADTGCPPAGGAAGAGAATRAAALLIPAPFTPSPEGATTASRSKTSGGECAALPPNSKSTSPPRPRPSRRSTASRTSMASSRRASKMPRSTTRNTDWGSCADSSVRKAWVIAPATACAVGADDSRGAAFAPCGAGDTMASAGARRRDSSRSTAPAVIRPDRRSLLEWGRPARRAAKLAAVSRILSKATSSSTNPGDAVPSVVWGVNGGAGTGGEEGDASVPLFATPVPVSMRQASWAFSGARSPSVGDVSTTVAAKEASPREGACRSGRATSRRSAASPAAGAATVEGGTEASSSLARDPPAAATVPTAPAAAVAVADDNATGAPAAGPLSLFPSPAGETNSPAWEATTKLVAVSKNATCDAVPSPRSEGTCRTSSSSVPPIDMGASPCMARP